MGLKYCKEHGYKDSAPEYNFCGICGKPLVEYPYCKCGFQLVVPQNDFCSSCGAKRPENQDRGK